MPETSQIYSLDVMFARVARFDPYVIELGRLEVTEFGRPLLATVRTNHASKFPRAQTIRAEQIAVAAFRVALFILKKADLRLATTERTRAFTARKLPTGGRRSCFCQPARVRLQDRLGEEMCVIGSAPVDHQLTNQNVRR